MRKRTYITIKLLLFVLCVTPCMAQFVLPLEVYADEDEEEEEGEEDGGRSRDIDALKQQIAESQAAKERANQTKNQLASGMASVQQVIGSLESEKEDIVSYVATLDAAMEQIQDDIAAIDASISENEIQIDEAKKAIDTAQKELDEAERIRQGQYEDIKDQIHFMYTTQKSTFADIIFTSKSMGDLLNRTYYINRIMEYDQKKLAEYAKTVEEADAAKKVLEENKAKLDEKQAELEEKHAEAKSKEEDMGKLIDAKEEEIGQYNDAIGDKEAQVREYEAMIAQQNAEIAAIEAAIRQQQAALQEANRRVYGGGQFVWPAPGYTRISDDYGMRTHPTLGVQMMHNGVDMAAPSGSPILAAADGTVIAASYSGTMGNYIMIDHGSDLISIYMHASSLNVSAGQEVGAGDRIGSVGSTGRSTGPHLHFGVRKNGAYVNPWSYLK